MKRIILAVLAATMAIGATASVEARPHNGRYYGRPHYGPGWHRGWERRRHWDRRAYYRHRYYYRHGRRYWR